MVDETHEQVSERRAAELSALLDIHLENVEEAHKMYPTPRAITARRLPGLGFGDWSDEDQRRWNERRATLDSANRAYNRAVRAAVQRHQEEDAARAAALAAAGDEPAPDAEAGGPPPAIKPKSGGDAK